MSFEVRMVDNGYLAFLALTGADTYPTGYVRYTTTEERRMLDLGLRLVFVVVVAAMTLHDLWKKRRIMTQDAGG